VLALVINTILGLIVLFPTNLIVEPGIPINIVTVLIVAIFGVPGWLLVLTSFTCWGWLSRPRREEANACRPGSSSEPWWCSSSC
jgi:hypothetical protein